MSRYVFSAEARAAYRSAITGHPQWDSYRLRNNLSAAVLTTEQLLSAGATFGLNPLEYGAREREKTGRRVWTGSPKPKTHDFNSVVELKIQFHKIEASLTEKQRDFAADIFATVYEKQDGCMTARQYQIISDMIAKAGNPAAPITPPAPAFVDTPAPAAPVYIASNPAPAPAAPAIAGDTGQQLASIIQAAIGSAIAGATPAMDESRIIALIKQYAATPAHVTLDLRTPAGVKPAGDGLMHWKFPLLLSSMQSGVNVMLVGPAGSGKTEAAKQAAQILGIPFYFTGAIDSPYKLLGFMDSKGEYVRTPFRDAFEHGGAFLLDELDGSLPSAIVPFNAGLSNDLMDFPDGIVKKHPDFKPIAAANTFGRGADRLYCGRYQLDAASLDRFAVLTWDYDPALESAIIGLPRPSGANPVMSVAPIMEQERIRGFAEQWVTRVQAIRARLELHKIRHVVSPRATIAGVKLYAAGWPVSEIEESVLWKGLESDARKKVA